MPIRSAIGRRIADWRRSLEQKWATLRFGEVKVETRGEQHVFEVQVFLNDLDPDAVRVELYADGVMAKPSGAAGDEARSPTGRRVRLLPLQCGRVCARPAADYTARVIPHRDGVAVPLEDARILWQR